MKKVIAVILTLVLLTMLQTLIRMGIRDGLKESFAYFDPYSLFVDLLISLVVTIVLALIYLLLTKIASGRSVSFYGLVLAIIGLILSYILRAFGGGYVILYEINWEAIKGMIPIFATALLMPFTTQRLIHLFESTNKVK